MPKVTRHYIKLQRLSILYSVENLHVSIIQSSLKWQDKPGNLEAFAQKISTINSTDLIILPEMFNTGFTMETASLAENMDGECISWMRDMAVKSNSVITGSLIIKSDIVTIAFTRSLVSKPDIIAIACRSPGLSGEHIPVFAILQTFYLGCI